MNDRIIVVTGFSRCGTSLMMRMLDAGGVETVCDNKTSFEDVRVNNLPHNSQWLEEAKGKAVKILEPLHFTPPRRLQYDFIWMQRNHDEQAKSQIKFLKHVGGWGGLINSQNWHGIAQSLRSDTPKMERLLRTFTGARILAVGFEHLLTSPLHVAAAVSGFIEREMNLNKMASVVVKRPPQCYPGFLKL